MIKPFMSSAYMGWHARGLALCVPLQQWNANRDAAWRAFQQAACITGGIMDF